jgi:hypothetical protein
VGSIPIHPRQIRDRGRRPTIGEVSPAMSGGAVFTAITTADVEQ